MACVEPTVQRRAKRLRRYGPPLVPPLCPVRRLAMKKIRLHLSAINKEALTAIAEETLTNGAVDPAHSEPPVSRPMYLGRFDLSQMKH
jgi:hypothetical protein